MKRVRVFSVVERTAAAALFSLLLLCVHAQAQTDPLPSWADRPAKQAILDLVKATTDRANPNFVPPEARIATFDQDGTTWVEHPIYTQIVYCLERVPALVKAKPELKNVEPFKTVLSGNRDSIAKLSTKELLKILAPPQTCEGRSPGNKGKMQWWPWRDWPYCNVRNFASWNRLCNRADTDVNDWDATDRWGPDDGTWEQQASNSSSGMAAHRRQALRRSLDGDAQSRT